MNKMTFAMGMAMAMVVPAGCSSAPSSTTDPAPDPAKTSSAPAKGTTGATADPSGAGSAPPPDAGSAPAMPGAGSGACTNAADAKVVTATGFQDKVSNCAQTSFGEEPGTKTCIKALGLTDECTGCMDDNITCVITNCLGERER